MPDFQSVRMSVLKRIKPSEKESKDVNLFVSRLLYLAKQAGFEGIVCGSTGKFTWLAGDHDIDLFVFFPNEVSREELERHGLELGKTIAKKVRGKWRIKYAEHPYVHVMAGNYDIDIVPCYKIQKGEHIKSAVDRSPLHLTHVLETLKPEQHDEVRLLKQFCKGAGVYGADAKTQGISGYICELLVIQYGGFEAVLKEATNWRAPHLIGTDDKRKFDAPFVVIDPTDANRNAAAAVSAENFARFAYAARMFLQKPSIEFFFPKTMRLSSGEIDALKKRQTYWVALVAPRPDAIDDVLWPQLRRARHRLVKELEQNEFKGIRSFDWADFDEKKGKKEIALVFELEVWSLPPVQRMHGPPITAHEHSARFLEKYGKPLFGPFVDGQGNWFIEKRRNFEKADELLRAFLKHPAKKLEELGIPDLVAAASKKGGLLSGNAFWNWVRRSDVSELMWKKYMKKAG